MSKLIYTSFSPNTRAKDLLVNAAALFNPFNYKTGDYPEKVKNWFVTRFNNPNVYTFNYARSGMYILFKSLNLNKGDEIVLQSFTCIAAANPIIWAGYKPVFCDIDPKTLTISVDELKKVITSKTRAVMYQNTFGNSAHLDEIAYFCKSKNIALIEDCTHTIGGKHQGQLIGSYGDASIFSFGRDKATSGVDGGVIIINNTSLFRNFDVKYKSVSYPSTKWIMQELFFPIIWAKVKATYTLQIGKVIHLLATKLHLLSRATTIEEKKGERSKEIPALFPNALARLAWEQLKDIDSINQRRNEIAKKYADLIRENQAIINAKFVKFEKGNFLLRLPLLVNNQSDLMEYLKKKNIFLGDWYNTPIAPKEVNPEVAGYKSGSCPTAESACREIINLPTHINISDKDIAIVINEIIKFNKSKAEI